MMRNRIVFIILAAWGLLQSAFAASVETDRSWYLAGEAMKIHIKADDAIIAYAELCDTQGLAAGAVVGLKGNEGTGTIELPPDLHSGYYVLSVYTRHNANVSQRLVAIINPLRKSADDDIQWVLGDSCWVTANGDSTNTQHLTPNTKNVDERETEGHIIKARVRNVFDGSTFRASQICPSLSIVGKQIHYFEGKMVDDSTAVFYTFSIHGRQQLVLSATSFTGVSLPIEMISPFAILLPKLLPHLVFHYKRSEVEARSLDMQRHQIAIASADSVLLDYDERAYGTKPDLSYNLDEYRQFFTVREVLIEYVNCVKTKKIEGVTKMLVRREQDTFDETWPAMVLIDGMPVVNVERLLAYDARRVHHINIYGGKYTFGNGVYNGILSFVTRSGRLTNYPVEPNMQYLVYDFPE